MEETYEKGDEIPANVRLNPKLTRRQPVERVVDDGSVSVSHSIGSYATKTISEDSDNETSLSTAEKRKKVVNPRLHLVHNGRWMAKQYEIGRAIPYTGVWDCCGSSDHYSLYCDSIDARDEFKAFTRNRETAQAEELGIRNKRKSDLLQHIQKAKEFSTGVASESVLTFEKQYMEKALSADNSFNAPILVAWILKHFNDESVIVKGLHYLLSNCKTGEGCSLVCRHGAVEALIKVHEFFKHHPPIQLAIMSAFRLFVDCNYTRDDVIRDDRVVSLCFSIAHLHMNSLAHVEPAIRCITQCSRRESNRRIIIKHNYIAYLITFSNRFHRVDTLLRSVLKLMNWISTSFERIVYLCKLKGVQFALKCLRAHKARKDVVTAATRFLFKAAEVYSPAIHLILRKGVIVDVIDSIKIGYDDDALQVETIRLLHLLAKTSEGWKQISDVKGGWQIITQGTTIGDALVHDLPGEFNNPGWSIGDTPYLTELDRKKLLATKLSQLSIQPEPTAAWTSFSLTEYMGLSTKGKTLAINTEKQAIYFELISTLNLLPTLREERETWFQRVIVFERESAVKLDEMVQTVQDMRRSDATRRQNIINGASDGDDIMGSVKPVYVLGTQITSASLEKTDDNIIEVLKAKGVI